MHELRLTIQGRVQGVGYRYFILVEARRLALGGSVRNLSDGDVEVIAQGDHAALERLLERARQGPRGAVVTAILRDWREDVPREPTFRIL